MSNTVGIEGVKEKIEKLHLVKLKTETELMAIRTGPQGNRNYAEVVRGQHYTQNAYSPRETTTRYNAYNRTGERNANNKVHEGHRYTVENQRYNPRGDSLRQRQRTQETMTCWT